MSGCEKLRMKHTDRWAPLWIWWDVHGRFRCPTNSINGTSIWRPDTWRAVRDAWCLVTLSVPTYSSHCLGQPSGHRWPLKSPRMMWSMERIHHALSSQTVFRRESQTDTRTQFEGNDKWIESKPIFYSIPIETDSQFSKDVTSNFQFFTFILLGRLYVT